MIPDLDYDLSSEGAIIADLEHVDKLKAELAAWRKGPWIRKADHDEAIARLRMRLAAAEKSLAAMKGGKA